jgi:hypothetical protein
MVQAMGDGLTTGFGGRQALKNAEMALAQESALATTAISKSATAMRAVRQARPDRCCRHGGETDGSRRPSAKRPGLRLAHGELRSMSICPWTRFSAFQSVSPCRTRQNRVCSRSCPRF